MLRRGERLMRILPAGWKDWLEPAGRAFIILAWCMLAIAASAFALKRGSSTRGLVPAESSSAAASKRVSQTTGLLRVARLSPYTMLSTAETHRSKVPVIVLPATVPAFAPPSPLLLVRAE